MLLAPTLSLSAGSGAAIVRPSFSRDFAGEKTLNNGTGPAITFTRASNATFFDASGTLQTASNDAPRFDHDPATGASRGLLIEEARTNSIRNSQAGGAVAGVSGTMPTNWSAATSSNGVTREVVATGTESGMSYVDIKLSGTPTATSGLFINTDSTTQVVAANGQTWTSSVYVALVGGSVSNAVTRIAVSGRNADGSVATGGQTVATTFAATSNALATQRLSATATFSSASVERVLQYVEIAYTSGNPIDLTLRIAAPQLEQGAFPTRYIPTTTAAATRSADSAVVTPISSFYNQAEGTLFAEAVAGTTNGTASGIHQQTVVQLLENNTGDILAAIYRQNSTTNGAFFVGNSGTQADLSQAGFTAGTNARLAAAYKVNDFALSVNGAEATTDTSGSLPTATTLRIGRYGTSSGFLNGHIRKIAYWPKRLTDTLLEQLTT
jgi:hypothetical protein